jgi:hypothetical protein
MGSPIARADLEAWPSICLAGIHAPCPGETCRKHENRFKHASQGESRPALLLQMRHWIRQPTRPVACIWFHDRKSVRSDCVSRSRLRDADDSGAIGKSPTIPDATMNRLAGQRSSKPPCFQAQPAALLRVTTFRTFVREFSPPTTSMVPNAAGNAAVNSAHNSSKRVAF